LGDLLTDQSIKVLDVESVANLQSNTAEPL